MKANELRIGNYIQYIPIKNPVKIIATDSRNNSIVHDNSEALIDGQYEPIPLTDEWLLKFGFAKKPNAGYHNRDLEYYDHRNMMLFIENDKYYLGYNSRDYDCERFNSREIKHVHQLQNLYFALTGDELTIK